MSDKTIYDLAITNIVNCLHECSKVTESIEGKTEFTRRSMESEPKNEASEADEAKSTPLACELARVQDAIDQLLGRPINLDNSICSTMIELGDSAPKEG